MSDYNVAIGQRIYDRRREKGLSREQLLEFVKISEVYLGMIERGKRGTSIEHMVQIADALGMSMDYMILGKEKDFDKSDSVAREIGALGTAERKLVDKFIRLIKANGRTKDSLKTIADIVAAFVHYEKTNNY